MAHSAKEEDVTTIEVCRPVVNRAVLLAVFSLQRRVAGVRTRHTCAVLNALPNGSFHCRTCSY